jgi:hypothetical protein
VHHAVKTLRDSLLTALVVAAWVLVAQVADSDLRARQRNAVAARGAA